MKVTSLHIERLRAQRERMDKFTWPHERMDGWKQRGVVWSCLAVNQHNVQLWRGVWRGARFCRKRWNLRDL